MLYCRTETALLRPSTSRSTALAPEQRRVKPVEQNRPPAALRVADFAGEDRLLGRFAAAVKLEISVANHLDQLRAQRLRRAAQDHVAGRVGGFGFRAQFAALFVHDAFAADDDDVFLQIVNVLDALDEQFQVERDVRERE